MSRIKEYLKRLGGVFASLQNKVMSNLSSIPKNYVIHLKNIGLILSAYTFVSLLIYPHVTIGSYCREAFSLLCAYGAILFWFMEHEPIGRPFRIAVCVTACMAPVLFMNNPFGVAFVALLLIILMEFVLCEYLRGCDIFSSRIPVYLVCDTIAEARILQKLLLDKYKVLELIVLNERVRGDYAISSLHSVDEIRTRLKKFSCLPFWPYPQRIMYFSSQHGNVSELLSLAAQHSLLFCKIVQHQLTSHNFTADALGITPATIADIDVVSNVAQEKSGLSSLLRGKRVWIWYDGRSSIKELIISMLYINAIDITIGCFTEQAATDIRKDLDIRCPEKLYQLKVMDLATFCAQDIKTDVIFYNMAMNADYLEADNMKEAVICNVLNTQQLINFASKQQVPNVFFLSHPSSINAHDWIGATLRLGELLAQFADSQRSKTRFRVIRVPNCVSDKYGVATKISETIRTQGYINVNFPNTSSHPICYTKDVVTLLLKTITISMKAHSGTACAYSIMPKKHVDMDQLIEWICLLHGLRKSDDVYIHYEHRLEPMELDNFPNISESLEKTNTADVFITKFPASTQDQYASLWTVDELLSMSTREMITAVFQSLGDKINGGKNG